MISTNLLQGAHVTLKNHEHVFLRKKNESQDDNLSWIYAGHSALQEAGVTCGMSSEACWNVDDGKVAQPQRSA